MDSIKLLNFNIENSYDYKVSDKVFEDGTYEFLLEYFESSNRYDCWIDIKLYVDYTKKIEKIIIESNTFVEDYAFKGQLSSESELFDTKEKIENFMNNYKDDKEVDMINQILEKVSFTLYTI